MYCKVFQSKIDIIPSYIICNATNQYEEKNISKYT